MAILDGIRQKIRLSLVLRLNGHAMLRLLSVFVALNVFLVALFCVVVWIRMEDAAGRAVTAIRAQQDPLLPSATSMLTVRQESYEGEWPGFTQVDGGFAEFLTTFHLDGMLLAPEATRRIMTIETTEDRSVSAWLNSLNYRLTYPATANASQQIVRQVIVIDAPVWPQLLLYGALLLAVMAVEFVLLLGSIPVGSRSARRILRPINEMATITRNINANRLDRRLNLKGSQNELQDLAQTINDMLDRIHLAYRSQIRFVSDASHELRTPIAVIQGYANLLDRWGKDDPQTLQESINALKIESENMKEMVEKLLFLARGDNDSLTLHKEPVRVDKLLEDMVRETAMIDPNHTYRIREQSVVSVEADDQLLKQALRILIDNSIKFTPSGREISLSCQVENDQVRIAVQDAGAGIAPDDIPYIFDRFYRADESRDRKTGGTGLGLSIAKWIVERHDGTIEVLSRQGLGTRISLLLPRLQTADSTRKSK